MRRRRIAAAVLLALLGAVGWGTASLLKDTGTGAASTRAGGPGGGMGQVRPRAADSSPTQGGVYRWETEPGDLSPAVRGVPERVYVPNSESGTVDVIDPRTFRIVKRFRVGRYDQHVNPSWDLKRLYVDNTADDSLTVVDPRTARPTGTIKVTDPYNLYFTPDGSKAIVVAESFHRLDFRDPQTWKLIKSVVIPANGPDHMDFSRNGRFLLLSTEFSGVLVRVNDVSMRVTGTVSVGGSPVDVKLAPDGRAFYVANQGLGGVFVISPSSLRILRFIRTGAGAHGLAVSRDARDLYVSNRLGGSISVISFATGHVVATWKIGGSPDMIQVSPDGSELWVSNRFNGTVSVVSTRTGRVLHVIKVGASPHGLTFFPQPGRHSLGHNGVYR